MKFIKKIISFMLAITLIFSGVVIPVYAEEINLDAAAAEDDTKLLEEDTKLSENEEPAELLNQEADEKLLDTVPQTLEENALEDTISVEELVNNLVIECLEVCSTDFEKALWLHDWIINNAECDDSINDCTEEDVFYGGTGNCEIYHNVYVTLLDKVGIQTGRITDNGHVWTAVKMDGLWYQIDTASDDKGIQNQGSYEEHLYFGLTDELMSLLHPEHVSAVAGYESTALENNYFINTGKIKEWSDSFVALIEQNMAEGRTEFLLSIPENMPEGCNTDVIYKLVAYQLSGLNLDYGSVTVSYKDRQLLCRVEYTQTENEKTVKNSVGSEIPYTVSAKASQLEIEKNSSESIIKVKLSNTSVAGNAQIFFPVWGTTGGQNDIIWYQGKKTAAGTYEAQIPVSAHKETGKYNIHAYVNQNGTLKYLTAGTVTISGITAEKMSWNEAISSVKAGKYRIEVEKVKSPASIQKVQIAVWSKLNGQDDIRWYDAKKNGNNWYLDMEIMNHQYEAGIFYAHAYATDSRGIFQLVNATSFMTGKMETNHLEIQKNSAESTITVTLSNASVTENSQVMFPAWGAAGGQNDIIWYVGKRKGERIYEAKIPVSSHKEVGKYNIHVYLNQNGVMKCLTGGRMEITGITAEKVSYNDKKSSLKDGKYRIEAKNVKSPSSVRNVQIAVWSKTNGQDDIRWYNAKKSGDIWYADIDVCYHKFDDGIYYVHIYAEDSRGIFQIIGAVNFLVSKIKRNSLQISMDKEQRYMTITLSAATTDGNVIFPVWGAEGGQNDIVWYNGTRVAPYTYRAVVDVAKHKEAGNYLVHVYRQANGTMSLLTSGSVAVKGITGGKIEAVVDRDTATVNVKISGLTGPSEISKVVIPVWTTSGGQDDIRWYEAKREKDGWSLLIDTANHNFETGTYNIHVYATDKRGIQNCVGGTKAVMDAAAVKVSAKLESNGANVNIIGTGIRGAKNVKAAIWGNVNGQNDIIWYNMSRSVGIKYQTKIDLYDHLETGTYFCHLYATGTDGVMRFVGATEFKVDKLNSNYLRILDIDNTNGRCTAKLYFPKAKKQIAGIQMAVWTQANGQDDIYWYNASKSGNVWNTTVDSLNHKCESGIYNIHIYAKCTDGSMECLTGSTFHMTRITRRYQNPAGYYQIQDSISLAGGGYNLSYGYEGVKVMMVIRRLGLGSGIGMGGAFYSQSVSNAVANFQRSVGLPATGNVDLLTWIHLGFSQFEWEQWGAYVSPIKVNKNSTREEHIEAMISTAYSYMGTAYVIGASGPPGTGIDCSGLVMQALYGAGLDISPMNPVRHAYPGYEYESRNIWASPNLMHVDYSQRQRGDLIFYQSSSGVVIHVAIYLGNDTVIESWPNQVVVWPIVNSQRANIKGVVRPFV